MAEPADPDPADPTAEAKIGDPLIDGLEQHVSGFRDHSERSAVIAKALASEVGLDEEESAAVAQAARLHAVGKIYLPQELVARPRSELLEGELAELEAHFEAGHRLAGGAGLPEPLCVWILHAREHWNGSGETGLTGAEIPIQSQIIRAVCEYDGGHRGMGQKLWRGEARELGLIRADKLAGTVLSEEIVAALKVALKRIETEDDDASSAAATDV